MKFDTETSDFSFTYEVNASIDAPSIAYFSDLFYPDGYTYVFKYDGVELQESDIDTQDSTKNYLNFKVTNADF